jgi:hypothetical protein
MVEVLSVLLVAVVGEEEDPAIPMALVALVVGHIQKFRLLVYLPGISLG